MKILIVGANGLLGRYLVKFFSKENNVYASVKDKNKLNFELNNNIEIIELDLISPDLSKLSTDIDVIFYLAQSNRFRDFPEGSDDMINVNIVAPNLIAEWAVKNNIPKFIYASSGGVYDSSDNPVKEISHINANKKLGFYLNSKLSAEMLLKNYANMFNSFIIIRPFFMYGLGQNSSMLIPRLIENIKINNTITLSGKKGIKINPIYIDDVVNAMNSLLFLNGEHIINIAGSEIISLKEISEKIAFLLNKEVIFSFSKEQEDLVADITTMKEKLWEPSILLDEGLSKMIGIY